MLRRRVTFEEPPGEGEGPEEPPRKRRAVAVGGPGSRFPAQPSLDSDEEEEEEEEEQRDEGPQVEGQEPGPAPGVGEGPVPLTPFNLDEELGEGRFDPEGHFLPRPQREPPDPWLEQIEGLPIKPRPLPPRDPPPSPPSPPPLPLLLGEVLELLRPGETVGGALRRWAGPGQGSKGRVRGRGRGQARAPPPPQLEALVALSDALVARGVLGVFGESRERIQQRLRELGAGPEEGHAHTAPGNAPGSPGHAPGSPGPWGEGPKEEEQKEGEGQSSGPAPLDMFAPPRRRRGRGKRRPFPRCSGNIIGCTRGRGKATATPPRSCSDHSAAPRCRSGRPRGTSRAGEGRGAGAWTPPTPPGPSTTAAASTSSSTRETDPKSPKFAPKSLPETSTSSSTRETDPKSPKFAPKSLPETSTSSSTRETDPKSPGFAQKPLPRHNKGHSEPGFGWNLEFFWIF
ncbi:CD2 antigen cytoplasmic tail-binding protein 2 [Zonotrichia albicollis]|uniref:CD2 antigen cytoplasmic tail-binding protein 2 n=1 Tax=Zonotrichia albicollis TaxID=44394 RepID=UPI003D810FB5